MTAKSPVATRTCKAVRGSEEGLLLVEVFAPEPQEGGEACQCRVNVALFDVSESRLLYGEDEFQALELALRFAKFRPPDMARHLQCRFLWPDGSDVDFS
jgi:hypothetical protein